MLTIAANKCDLEKERSVPEAVIAAYAADINASYFNTSAKTGAGLEQAFVDIAKRCLEQQHARLAQASSFGSQGSLCQNPAHATRSMSLSMHACWGTHQHPDCMLMTLCNILWKNVVPDYDAPTWFAGPPGARRQHGGIVIVDEGSLSPTAKQSSCC